MSYRYQNGERPLDGYTIQYALGRGGFGEVYFAISDSGREVALKAVQNYEEVELRGIGHCMNLKSPHLVMIFDVRHAADGVPWVIMEYVSGPSLRDILDEAPNGLDIEQVRFFMRELCKGLSYLHDAGVVHRDLKPHNVFFEDGIVKIGDYSLSKVITNSHRSGNTMTVGSVHYMAPEISMGRYDKTVDIYALGCMLFEMLTGKPPHVGESMGEVLMKHLSQEPNTEGLTEPFAAAVTKAMQREPSERFATAYEFATAIQEADTPSLMDTFHPATLSLAGQRARASRQQTDRKIQTAGRMTEPSSPPPIAASVLQQSQPIGVTDSTAPTMRGDTGDLPQTAIRPHRRTPSRKVSFWQTMGLHFTPAPRKTSAPDELSMGWKLLLLIALAVLGTMTLLMVSTPSNPTAVVLRGWLTIVAGGLGLILSLSDLINKSGYSQAILTRVVFGIMGVSAGALLAEAGLLDRWLNNGLMLAFVIGFSVPDWRCFISPDRSRRIVVPATLFAGGSAALCFLLPIGRPDVAAVAGGTVMLFALAMQIACPFRKSDLTDKVPQDQPRHSQKPRLAFDRVSIFLEAVFLGAAVTVTALIMEGDDEMLGASIPFALAGMYALYQRLQRRTRSDGTVRRKGSTVLLDLMTLTSAGIFLAMAIQGDSDLLPGLVIFGSLAVVFGRLRYLKNRRSKKTGSTNLRLNKTTAFFELVGYLAVGTAISLAPWFDRYDEYIVAALAAIAVAIIAFRIRISRNLFQEDSVEEMKSW